MRTSKSVYGCKTILSVVLACCLADTVTAANPRAAGYERRKVQSVRKYRLAAERDGTAKDRRAFGSSYMTDAAIDEVVMGYANLETLSAACHGNVTDAGVSRACQLKKLKILYLAGDRITDSGLKPLSSLKQLTKLRLRSTLITDAGLQHLKGLTSLQRLYLTGTNVTDAGVKDLQASLPKCKITR